MFADLFYALQTFRSLSECYETHLYVFYEQNLGDDSDGDPPLTIPNREVKPISAEDT